jgi:ABC-type transport system involved in cytochrome bd biosynthesis fused ATPase/permease subunit
LANAACECLDPRRRIAQNGADVSAGERQRIALARCFLRAELGADLLLLDEPTAHLDAPTEQRTLAAIRELSVGRFVLMVAHRPSAIDFADRTVEVGAGIPEERPMTSAALS